MFSWFTSSNSQNQNAQRHQRSLQRRQTVLSGTHTAYNASSYVSATKIAPRNIVEHMDNLGEKLCVSANQQVPNLTKIINGPGGDGYVKTLEEITADKNGMKEQFHGVVVGKFNNVWMAATQEACDQHAERIYEYGILRQIYDYAVNLKIIRDNCNCAISRALEYHGEHRALMNFQQTGHGLRQRINLTKSLLPVLSEDKEMNDAKQEE